MDFQYSNCLPGKGSSPTEKRFDLRQASTPSQLILVRTNTDVPIHHLKPNRALYEFDENLYKQVDRAPMRSPLSNELAQH